MSESVAYEQFDETGEPASETEPTGDLRRLSEVPVETSVEIGRTAMTVGETLELRVGSVVKLDRLAGEPVDLLVNGTLIAHGEVVVVDEQFGLRVTEIVEGDAAAAAALQAQLASDGGPAPIVEPAAGVAPARVDGALELPAAEQAGR